ncbi:MAG: hypothetical protein MUE50_22680 [Pirellulaceae bacterium]|nr:hypothetical protein [Pirellulaceae bacterium]
MPKLTSSLPRPAVKRFRAVYGRTHVADFRPRGMEAMQLKRIETGHSRCYVNMKDSYNRAVARALAKANTERTTQGMASLPT